MAGLAVPDTRITGHDLTPLGDPEASGVCRAQSTYGDVANNMIRTESHKLIQYMDGSREVYDMLNDPEEFDNLAGKRSVEKVEAQLDELLEIAIEEGTYSSN